VQSSDILTLYVFLVLAIIVTFWLRRGASGWRWASVAGAILLLLPNVTSSWWRSAFRIPPFFGEGIYRQYIGAGEHVLQVPIDNRADGSSRRLGSPRCTSAVSLSTACRRRSRAPTERGRVWSWSSAREALRWPP
jgi:hypothetical protein